MFKFLRRKVDPKTELLKVLGGATLPSFSAVAVKALRLIRTEESSMSAVGETVMVDPGLSARLLKIVNSAGHGLKRPVNSVAHAAAMLGRAQVESVLLSVAVGEALPRVEAPEYNPKQFWLLAAQRASISRAFAKTLHPSTQQISYTAGLLQDMAIPLLVKTNGSAYTAVLTTWREQGGDLAALERKAFGWDHAEVASWMCAQWRFPELIAEGISGHHECTSSLPAVTLAAHLGADPTSDGAEALMAAAQAQHGIAPERSRELLEQATAEAGEVASLFH